jgi:hypothetical protein
MTGASQTTIAGEVTDIFAHRFVVATAAGKTLADLGPQGAAQVVLREGDAVTLSGEMKPSELKVRRIAKNGGPTIVVEHKGPRPHPGDHDEPDPRLAVKTAEANGFRVLGSPRRKPQHLEILARDERGELVELHVEYGGALRHARPVDKADVKWAAEIRVHSPAHVRPPSGGE